MDRDYSHDQLRALSNEEANAERQMAAQEELILGLKRKNLDSSEAQRTLDEMIKKQETRQQERRRILGLSQP